jgi:hypothetical protein
MPQLSTWNLDPTRLLTRRELAAVLADLTPRAQRSANTQRSLVIVRLACCCGLRVNPSFWKSLTAELGLVDYLDCRTSLTGKRCPHRAYPMPRCCVIVSGYNRAAQTALLSCSSNVCG